MNVSLDPQLEELVRRKVASGLYGDANAVLREALELLDKRDRFEALRAAVAEGMAEIERGEYIEWTPGMMDQLRREADEADRLGLPLDEDVMP